MKYKKLCAHCGQPFETNSPQKIYCDRTHYRPCPVCGKPVKMYDNDFSRKPACCSNECTHKLRSTNFKKKKCVLCGKMFTPNSGVQIACNDTHYDKCEICGKTFIRTISNLNDGVTTCSHECTRKKMERNSLKKYGTKHPMQSNTVQQIFHESMVKKYGVKHALQIPGKINQQQESVVKTNTKRYGVPYACFLPQCQEQHPKLISNINKNFANKLERNNITYEFEHRIETKSYDIQLTDTNILIEIDPTYTHNVAGNHWGEPIDRYYHRDKTQLAENNDFRCIHVFDWDDWDNIIELVVHPEHKIHARKCTVYRIDKNVGDNFLSKYHLQGTCRGQLLYLGLVYDDELIQVMTFGRSRFDKKYDVELMRMATKYRYRVSGGASRLFSYATSEYGLSNIISYCDRSKFTGSVYEKIGMKLKRTTPPQEIWSRDREYITANLLRARGYDQLFGTSYGKGTSNEELMIKSGWLPVYDCGQRVYVFE